MVSARRKASFPRVVLKTCDLITVFSDHQKTGVVSCSAAHSSHALKPSNSKRADQRKNNDRLIRSELQRLSSRRPASNCHCYILNIYIPLRLRIKFPRSRHQYSQHSKCSPIVWSFSSTRYKSAYNLIYNLA